MKTRNGFVSNSSSSSFLISKPSSDINVAVPTESRPLPASVITDVKGLLEVFEANYWGNWKEDPEEVAKFIEATEKLAKGETLFYIVTSDWDEDGTFWLIDEIMEANNITILNKGYY